VIRHSLASLVLAGLLVILPNLALGETCTFNGTLHGSCYTYQGRMCFIFHFVIQASEDCQPWTVDLYRVSPTEATWSLVGEDVYNGWVDCPDWSQGPFDYKLVLTCKGCGKIETTYLQGIDCR
jgi:hypothetical protein